LKNLHEEHQKIQGRKVEIERRKELHEQQLKLQAMKEEEERKKKQLELEEIERERQRQSALEREKIKKQKEDEEKKEKERAIIANMISQKANVDPDLLQGLETIDPEEFVRKRIEQHEREELEKVRRLAKLDKKLDWVERIIRIEEAPLVTKSFDKQSEEDKVYEAEHIKKLAQEHLTKWEHDKTEKSRFAIMANDKKSFESEIMTERNKEFEKLKKERDERVAVKRAKIIEEREKRKKDEQERQSELEKERKVKDEEDRKKRDVEDKRRQEATENQRKLQEFADKQRKREEEALAKEQKTEARR